MSWLGDFLFSFPSASIYLILFYFFKCVCIWNYKIHLDFFFFYNGHLIIICHVSDLKKKKHHRVQAPRSGERGSHGVNLITCLATQKSHCSRSHCNTFINNRVKIPNSPDGFFIMDLRDKTVRCYQLSSVLLFLFWYLIFFFTDHHLFAI